MARPSKHQRAQRRAQAAIETAFARGQLVKAAELLDGLSSEQRASAAARLQRALPRAIEDLRDVPARIAWAERVVQNPSLAPESGSLAGQELRWRLLVAVLQVGRWPLATELWEELVPQLPGTEVTRLVGELIATAGRPELAPYDKFLASRGEASGQSSPPVELARPTDIASVEARCSALFGSTGWDAYYKVVCEWMSRAPSTLGAEIARVSADLGQVELLTSERANLLESASRCALLIKQAGSPSDQKAIMAAGLRAVARSATGDLDRAAAESCLTVLTVALGYETLLPGVELLACRLQYSESGIDTGLRLTKRLLEHSESWRVLAASGALLVQRTPRDEFPEPAPSWLQEAASCLLESGEAPSNGVSPRGTRDLLMLLEPDSGVRFLELAWPALETNDRLRLAEDSYILLDRIKRQGPITLPDDDFAYFKRMFEDSAPPGVTAVPDVLVRKYMATAEGRRDREELARDRLVDEPVTDAVRPQYRRAVDCYLPYSLELLEELLGEARKAREMRTLVGRYWVRFPTLRERVLHLAELRMFSNVALQLYTYLLVDWTADLRGAAEALNLTVELDAPLAQRKRLAKLVFELSARRPPSSDSVIVAALRHAARLQRRRRSRKKRKGPGAGAPGHQLDLFAGPEKS